MTYAGRISFDPDVMGSKSCIRGLRITVGTVLTLLRDHTPDEILADDPELETEVLDAALRYAAYVAEERELPVG